VRYMHVTHLIHHHAEGEDVRFLGRWSLFIKDLWCCPPCTVVTCLHDTAKGALDVTEFSEDKIGYPRPTKMIHQYIPLRLTLAMSLASLQIRTPVIFP